MVRTDQVDEYGAVKSKRRTWKPSGRAVSTMDIVVATVEEAEDVVAIGAEVTAVMVNPVCEVDEVDIVVGVANLRQFRNNYSHFIPDIDGSLYGVSRWGLSLFDLLDKSSAVFHHIHCLAHELPRSMRSVVPWLESFRRNQSAMKEVRVSFLVYYQHHDAYGIATAPARIYGRLDQ
jgi:hypothetical protein